MLDTVYDPSPIKRKRATKKDMEERAQFLISYAREHSPVTVRQLYYAAEVAEVSGIDKEVNSSEPGCQIAENHGLVKRNE